MDIAVKENVPLAPLTTLGVGGEAEYFAVATTVEELAALKSFARERGQPVTILGGGSNVVVDDGGIKGLVIKNEIKGHSRVNSRINSEVVLVSVGAGEDWDEFVSSTMEEGLWGLENLSGIPGTVGGAIVQNVNAYGVTIADLVVEVDVLDLQTGASSVFNKGQCEFEYRNSFFKKSGDGKNYVVTGVKLQLSSTPVLNSTYRSATQSLEQKLKEKGVVDPTPAAVRSEVLEIRSNVGMLKGQFKSAGSFFTNPIISQEVFDMVKQKVETEYAAVAKSFSPWHWMLPDGQVKVSAAFLMECTPYNKTDFKEKSFNGRVGISPRHTLSIINLGDATADDIKNFVAEISDAINSKFKIKLKSEVCFL